MKVPMTSLSTSGSHEACSSGSTACLTEIDRGPQTRAIALLRQLAHSMAALKAMRPAIERRAQRIVGPGSTADALARLEHGDGKARIVQQARGDQARHAGADHDHALPLGRAHGPGAGHASTRPGSLAAPMDQEPVMR